MIICSEGQRLYDEKILVKTGYKQLTPARIRNVNCDMLTVYMNGQYINVSPLKCILEEDYKYIQYDFSDIKHPHIVLLHEDNIYMTLIFKFILENFPRVELWYEYGHKMEYEDNIDLIIKEDYFEVNEKYNIISIPSGPEIWKAEIFAKTIFL